MTEASLETNKIYNMDCLDGIKLIKDNSIDLIVIDPPYPINTNNGTNRFTQNGWFVGTQDNYSNVWYSNFENVLQELKRTLKEGKHFYCFVDEKNLFLLKPILDKYFTFKKVIIWHKDKFGLGYHYRNVIEYIFLYSKGDSNQFINDEPNFFRTSKEESIHPTAKPVNLLRWLIKNSSKKDEIILDCYIGSGTTAIASLKMERNFIGFEIDIKFCDYANKRIKKYLEQTKLV